MEFCRLQPRRLRKPNWSREEVHLLLRELQKEARNLFGSNASQISIKAKAFIWQKIATNISALGVAPRTSLEVRLKWKGLKKDVLEKHKEQTPTGRGKQSDEEMVRAVIWDRCLCFGNQRCNRCRYSLATQQQNETASGDMFGSRAEVAQAAAAYPGIHVPMNLPMPACPTVSLPVHSEPVDGVQMAPMFLEETSASASSTACVPVKTEPVEDVPGSPNELNASAPSAGIPSAIPDRPRGFEMCHPMTPRRPAVGIMASSDGRADASVDGRAEISVDGRAETPVDDRAHVNEKSLLYREYLKSKIERNKSEVEKNNLLMQKLKKDMEDMEERKNREVTETNLRLFMYKTIQQTAMMISRSRRPFQF